MYYPSSHQISFSETTPSAPSRETYSSGRRERRWLRLVDRSRVLRRGDVYGAFVVAKRDSQRFLEEDYLRKSGYCHLDAGYFEVRDAFGEARGGSVKYGTCCERYALPVRSNKDFGKMAPTSPRQGRVNINNDLFACALHRSYYPRPTSLGLDLASPERSVFSLETHMA